MSSCFAQVCTRFRHRDRRDSERHDRVAQDKQVKIRRPHLLSVHGDSDRTQACLVASLKCFMQALASGHRPLLGRRLLLLRSR